MTENCALPGTLEDPHLVFKRVRALAHRYGSVKTFKAYAESPDQRSPKIQTLRAKLQSCGVSLIDCPHNGRKDIADKMIMGKYRARCRFIMQSQCYYRCLTKAHIWVT